MSKTLLVVTLALATLMAVAYASETKQQLRIGVTVRANAYFAWQSLCIPD